MGVPPIIPFYEKYTPLIIPLTFFFFPCSVALIFKKDLYGNEEEMMWKLIDDWYCGIFLDTQLIVFVDLLNSICKYSPLHDITLC